MVKYTNLKPRTEDTLRALVDAATNKNTTPHGIKTVRPGEGLQLITPTGHQILWDGATALEYEDRMTVATTIATEATTRLEQTERDLDAANARIDESAEQLNTFGTQITDAQTTITQTATALADTDKRLGETATELQQLGTTITTATATAQAASRDAAAAATTADAANAAAAAAAKTADSLSAKLDAALAAKPGMIADSSFELPEQWLTSGLAEIVESPTARTGKNVLRINGNSSTSGNVTSIYTNQVAAVKAGREYRLTAHLRSEGEINPAAGALFLIRNGTDNGLWANNALTTFTELGMEPGKWATLQWTWLAPADGMVRFGLQTRYQTSAVEWDDYQAVDGTEEASLRLEVADAKQAAEDAAAAAVEAMAAANQAQESADGKTVTTATTAPPAGHGITPGDTHLQMSKLTPGATVRAAWQWTGIEWADYQIGSEFIAHLDVGRLTGVFADISQHLRAGAITTDLLTIGLGANVVPNGDGQAPQGWEDFGFNSSGPETNNGYPGSFWLQGRRNGATRQFAMRPGEHAWKLSAKGSKPGSRYYVQLHCFDRNNARLTPAPYLVGNAQVLDDAAWDNREGTVTAPPGTVRASLYVYGNHPNGVVDETAYQWFTGVVIQEKVGGNAIIEGSLFAQHVNAPSIAGAVGRFLELSAEQVSVTNEFAARLAKIMTTETAKLYVSDEAIIQHATLLGTTVAEEINVNGLIRGRDAIIDGTIDVEQLYVTERMASTIVEAMDLYAKRAVVTEDAILQRATVIEGLVTPELISDKANIRDLAAKMITGGHIQTSTTAARGVKINDLGIQAWDTAGRQTMRINGTSNFMTGEFSTAPTGQRVRLRTTGTIAAMDLYGSNDASDHMGIWYDSSYSPSNPSIINAVGRVVAMTGATHTEDSPGVLMWPWMGAVGMQGRWAPETNAMKFVRAQNNTGLKAGEWQQVTLPYVRPFPTNNSIRIPFVSVQRTYGADMMANIVKETEKDITIMVVNKSTSGSSGPIAIRAVIFNAIG